jgi:hypothetical protein
MRRAGTCVLLSTTLLLAGPVRAAQPNPGAASAVEAMNRAGFAAFASFGPDHSDVMVSPFLTWYVHRLLSLHSEDPQARTLVDQLRRSGVVIDTTVHAARNRSGYTDAVASYEREDLGVATTWVQPPESLDSAWSVDVDIRTHDDLLNQLRADVDQSYLRAPFYAGDGIRAVRLDAFDGTRSLFVFLGPLAALTGMRTHMSAELWQRISRAFSPTDVEISALVLDRRSAGSFPTVPGEGFGSRMLLSRGIRGIEEAVRERLAISASTGAVSVHLVAAQKGDYQTGSSHVVGAITHIDPSAPVPDEHRLSMIAPALYVVQDTRTGAILLMGEHG